MPRSMCVQSEYCLGLLGWGCMYLMLSVRMARSMAQTIIVILYGEVLK